MSLTGAEAGLVLCAAADRDGHLALSKETNGDLWLKARTDILFTATTNAFDAEHRRALLNRTARVWTHQGTRRHL